MTKRSFADEQRAIQAALSAQETMYGDLRIAKGQKQLGVKALAPKREIVNRTDPAELEGAVMKEVGHILAVHPKVLFAARVNSGGAWLPGKNGKDAPVFFYRIVRSREKMRIVDYIGQLINARPFAFECKRADWKFNPKDAREIEQEAYLNMVRESEGVAAFVTSGAQALEILERA